MTVSSIVATFKEDCFVAPRSYSPQSKASGILKLGGDKSFLITKNIESYLDIQKTTRYFNRA